MPFIRLFCVEPLPYPEKSCIRSCTWGSLRHPTTLFGCDLLLIGRGWLTDRARILQKYQEVAGEVGSKSPLHPTHTSFLGPTSIDGVFFAHILKISINSPSEETWPRLLLPNSLRFNYKVKYNIFILLVFFFMDLLSRLGITNNLRYVPKLILENHFLFLFLQCTLLYEPKTFTFHCLISPVWKGWL